MLESLVADALALVPSERSCDGPGRVVLGLAGAPAAGKSTLARYLVRAVDERSEPGTAGYLPMDGFHLSNAQLDRLGRRNRKGAPDTFDAHGYLAMVRRLLAETDHPVYVPDYDRRLHEPIAAQHVVEPHTRLIVTEGNYLASDEKPWSRVRGLLGELWYVETEDRVRERRLRRRQMAGGASARAAEEWVERSDRPNGEFVKGSRDNCTRIVRVSGVPRLGSGDRYSAR
ncbi:nucleoside/nucleotide kinase family protein [Nocardiopsis terrae]|uniref:Pantothenate kinase n=1 Tax=Nocardiopsis terrae TaxID=372655 RepID=A0ABR9HHR0_9ACTN|nr:nucleoside/nucleotide kinase family protein [Nocardiopsis terrae]MBE1458566.1 pantothenate kinase [Nocardiopsis terrae]GHC79720.1 nucleoside/nucleotide kinase family protein [Nocardiopsis terrae]